MRFPRASAALVVLLLAGCQAPAGQPAAAPPPPSPPAPTPAADITLAFAGDVHFADRTLPLLDHPATAFGPIAATLAAADVAMVNLETAVTGRGTPEPKTFHFRAPANAFAAVKAAGVDVVTIANNHALDYGRVGLADTVAAARAAGVPAIGGGTDAGAAYAPWITVVRGTTIAFLGFDQVAELWTSWKATDSRPGLAMARDLPRAVAAVRAARSRADIVVAYVHWGVEGQDCPAGEQRSFAAALADAGADLVVGAHAHLLLGGGWLGRTYVQYGLGNFVWWRDDAYSNDTGVLRVTMHGRMAVKAELVPASISRRTGQPVPVAGDDAVRITRKYAKLRECAQLAGRPSA